MTSLERVKEYTTIDAEKLDTSELEPKGDWPKRGEIEFKNVSLRYDKSLPLVLDDLTFRINPGEKLGVVGRTGAGKSSLIQALFRIAEPEGEILIDRVPISHLSLHDLRNHLSIIPQEPTLFAGTIRSNLDPLNRFSDHVLWQSLEQVQLKQTVMEMSDGLDSEVHKGGSNLSVGQKQLICLARAMVRRSKILVIDEATANVDFKTDQLIQSAIRECFKECTVVTIAHRLNTIIDSDRILCLNNGRVENLDTPYELIRNKSSILSGLLDTMDRLEREKLVEVARKSSRAETDENKKG